MHRHFTGYDPGFLGIVVLIVACGGSTTPPGDGTSPTDAMDVGAGSDDSTSVLNDGQIDSQVQDDGSDQGNQVDTPGEELPFQNLCPQPVIEITEGTEVPPQTIVHLNGESSIPSSGAINLYTWSVDQPEENKFNMVPTLNFPNPTHEVSVVGTYTYCLDVCDAQFCSNDAQCQTTVCKEVVVVPGPGLHCELTWDTPGDPDQFDEGPGVGSDMDLHLAHEFATGPDLDGDGEPDPWFDLTYDCFWYNASPTSGSMNPNVHDAPSMDRDDTDGAGPETINLLEPDGEHSYRIGVHYWDDHGFGPSYPKVRCMAFGQLILEKDLKELSIAMEKCDMWFVAIIQSSLQVIPVQNPQGGPNITPCYQNPAFVQIGGDTCDCN